MKAPWVIIVIAVLVLLSVVFDYFLLGSDTDTMLRTQSNTELIPVADNKMEKTNLEFTGVNTNYQEGYEKQIDDEEADMNVHEPTFIIAPVPTKQERLGLCVFVQGTTTSTYDHMHEMDDLIRIYQDLGMNEKHVYYFMDRKRVFDGVEDPEKFCARRKIRCVYIEYPNDKFSFKAKTFAMFDYVQQNKIYEQCDFMMKLDSDAYVDIPAYSAFLHYRFNALENHYSGQLMLCEGKMFVQGTYVLSRGIFANNNDVNFTRDKDIGASCGKHDDAFVGIYLSVFKNISMTNTKQHTLGFGNEDALRTRWADNIKKGKGNCLFVCHKCAGSFRDEFAGVQRNLEMAGNASCNMGSFYSTNNTKELIKYREKQEADKAAAELKLKQIAANKTVDSHGKVPDVAKVLPDKSQNKTIEKNASDKKKDTKDTDGKAESKGDKVDDTKNVVVKNKTQDDDDEVTISHADYLNDTASDTIQEKKPDTKSKEKKKL